MIPDYHIHTYLCKHAEGEVTDYLQPAHDQGITEMCFTDHVPAPDGYDETNRMSIDQFPTYKELIANLRELFSGNLLYGIEADYYQGCEIFHKAWLLEQDFDLVLGSIHYIKDWGFDNPDNISIWETVDVKHAWREYFSIVGDMADSGMFDVASHLDIPKKFGFRPSDKHLVEMAQPALDKIAKAGMGIEINTSGLRRPVKEMYPSPLLLELACEREIPVCFGSDAHRPEDVGFAFEKAVEAAKDAGYTHRMGIRRREKELFAL